MTEKICIPIREVRGEKWGALSYLGPNHEIVGEDVKCVNYRYSFAGNHRVQLYRFKKNVHWRLPKGVDLDISEVDKLRPRRRKGG